MKIAWKDLKKFIDDTELYHFLNYTELNDMYYVWVLYQGESLNCTVTKGSVDCEDFINNYKPRAVLKNDINQDGIPIQKSRHVTFGRFFHSLFVLITTSKTEHNDTTGYIDVKTFDESGHETTVPDDVVKTCINFHPNFIYELYGGGLQILDDHIENLFINSILNPDNTNPPLGRIKLIINKKVISSQENIFKSATIPGELPYSPLVQMNYLRIEISHDKGEQIRAQIEIQYYS